MEAFIIKISEDYVCVSQTSVCVSY